MPEIPLTGLPPDLSKMEDQELIRYMFLNTDPDGVFRIYQEESAPVTAQLVPGMRWMRGGYHPTGEMVWEQSFRWADRKKPKHYQAVKKGKLKRLCRDGYIAVTTFTSQRWSGGWELDDTTNLLSHVACVVTDKGKELIGL